MAKAYRKQRVTRFEYKSVITCDFCKSEIREVYGNDDEVTIEAKIGNVWPEGDHRNVAELDCCAKCFVEKVQPCIETHLGVKFREHDAEEYGPGIFDRTLLLVEDLGEVKA